MAEELVEITLTVSELTALLDVTEDALSALVLGQEPTGLMGADSKLHVALEGTDWWAEL
jgi:hypothetical protein